MMRNPSAVPALARIAVAGHANTGKTSLLRTLAHAVDFGEVCDEAGTTRHVEGLRLQSDSGLCVDFFDTPGLEEAQAVYAFVAKQNNEAARHDGPWRLAAFLEAPEACGVFEQEAKVIRQVLKSDALLYVVDVRDPILPKHLDELALLTDTGKPLLPVFNFTQGQEARMGVWRERLAKMGLHLAVAFDTVAPAHEAERQLFDLLARLLHTQGHALAQFQHEREQARARRSHTARTHLADTLLRLAAFQITADLDENAVEAAQHTLQARVREAESRLLDTLLRLYRFRPNDAALLGLPGFDGRFQHDLFDRDTLAHMGIDVGGGMAKGAAVGAGFDVLLAGLSLGTGTAVGALAGGVWQTAHRYGAVLAGRFRGHTVLRVPDAVLTALARRFCELWRALEQRGHGAVVPSLIRGADTEAAWPSNTLPKPLKKARLHPDWFDKKDPSPAYEKLKTEMLSVLPDEHGHSPQNETRV